MLPKKVHNFDDSKSEEAVFDDTKSNLSKASAQSTASLSQSPSDIPGGQETKSDFFEGQKVLAYYKKDQESGDARPMRSATVKRDNLNGTIYLVYDEGFKDKKVPVSWVFELDGKPTAVSVNGMFESSSAVASPSRLTRSNTTKLNEEQMRPTNQSAEIEIESVEEDYQEAYYCAAVADWVSTNAGDLCLVKDEVYRVDHAYDDGWWYGRNSDSQAGTFPSNFVYQCAAPLTFFKKEPTQAAASHPKTHIHFGTKVPAKTATKIDLGFMSKSGESSKLGSQTPKYVISRACFVVTLTFQ